jgi:hypothetical protein
MKTLTVKVDGDKEAKMLLDILRSIKFVKEANMEDDLTDEEKNILEDRLSSDVAPDRGDFAPAGTTATDDDIPF